MAHAQGEMTEYPRTSPRWRAFLAAVAMCTLASCAGVPEDARRRDGARQAEAKTALPSIVAIMPFRDQSGVPGAAERLRASVYNHLNAKPYVDVELAFVDEQIVLLERSTGKNRTDLSAREICRVIGCDGLVFGDVIAYTSTFAGVFSHLGASAELWMVNANTGAEVMRARESVDRYEGGIPLTPLGALMTAMSAAVNVSELQETRMVGELAAKLVGAIPVPAGVPAIRRPVINELITNAAQGPFGRGAVIRVGLDGEPGVVAAFDIGNFRKSLPLKETQPGVYLGEYAVLPGDNTADMPIIATLKRPSGPESQWIDSSGRVAIDTQAPEKVANLRARGAQDSIVVSWDYWHEDPDVSEFVVMRSEKPRSGYEEVATVETTEYEDTSAQPDGVYHYRVVAVDEAGNRSEPAQTTSARLATAVPSVLTGELSRDTVLSGIYVLQGELFVPRGVALRIAAQTSIMAEAGSRVVVEGRLIIDGANGLVRIFPHAGQQWTGILVRGGRAEMNTLLLSGAEAGVTFEAADGAVDNAVVIDNGVGMRVAGEPGISVRNCWIAANKTGLELTGTASRIVQSVIVRNAIGVSLRGFGGEIKDNIITGNERDIVSDRPLKLDPNYLGRLPHRHPRGAANAERLKAAAR